MKRFKRIIAASAALTVAAGSFGMLSVSAQGTVFDGEYSISADKTAQWTNQEASENYDLKIHGWKAWETAAYMGFTLPEDFTAQYLTSAELVLDTTSVNASGEAYVYTAGYSTFENGKQYEGTNSAPSYTTGNETAFTSPSGTGESTVDVTQYMASLADGTKNIAFRIDVKSQNTNNNWWIGSCNNGGKAPELVLNYDNPNVQKTEVTVNVKTPDGTVLRTYSDKVRDADTYTVPDEYTRYERRNNTVYYLPQNAQTTYPIEGDSAEINIELSEKSDDGLVMFEDFAGDKQEQEKRGFGGDYTSEGAKAVLESGQTLTLPSMTGYSNMRIECDYTGDIEVSGGDDVSFTAENGHLSAQGSSITGISGEGTVDNLMISLDGIVYSGVANPDFSNGTNGWTVSGNAVTKENTDGAYAELDAGAALTQKITGLENGSYNLSVDVLKSDIDETARVYVKTNGAPINSASAAGSGEWRTTVIQGIDVTDGELEIGLEGKCVFTGVDLVKTDDAARAEFLTGGDITEVSYVESCGGKYYDENGNEKDPIQLLAERGFNFARVRIYNDPGKGHGDGTYYLPEGFQNLEDGLSLSKRAKDKGMQVELTIYYSDYWADGGRQLIPNAWKQEIAGMSNDEAIAKLEELIYDYTVEVMTAMKEQGTVPEYVSLGNEIQGGILYDYGRKSNFATLAKFLNAGARAVREVSPDTKIVIHLDGTMGNYQSYFDNCKKYGVDYDVIGPSYYPFWTDNTVDEIVDFYNGLITRYDKDILVMETGYNFNPTKPDGYPGQLSDNGPYQDVYPSSPNGQRAFMEEVFQGLRSVAGGRCIGDLYWDPMMIYHDGVGWAMIEATDKADTNVVSNTTLFDFDGKALPAFKAFENNGYTPGYVGIGGTVSGKENSQITISINGSDYTVNTDRMGGYFVRVPYADEMNISSDGMEETYSIDMRYKSIANGIDFNTGGADVPEDEILSDGSFESDFIGSNDWTFAKTGGWYANADGIAERTTGTSTDGEYSVKLQNATIGQRVRLEEGVTYTLSADIKAETAGAVTIGFYDGTQEWPASNDLVTQDFSVSGDWQNVTVEYECTRSGDYVICLLTWDGSVVYADNIAISEPQGITSLTADKDENGVIHFSAQYATEDPEATIYTALYGKDGTLKAISEGVSEGNFNVTAEENETYTVKAYLWNEKMSPLSVVKSVDVTE